MPRKSYEPMEKMTQAKKALQKSLMEIAAEKPYSDISVTELCAGAFVARSTFYANYRNTDELLEETEDCLIAEISSINMDISDPKEISKDSFDQIEQVMEFVLKNRETLEVLLIKQPDFRFVLKWKNEIKDNFKDLVTERVGEKGSGLVLEIIASMAIGAYTWQVEHSSELNSKDVVHMINAIIENGSHRS